MVTEPGKLMEYLWAYNSTIRVMKRHIIFGLKVLMIGSMIGSVAYSQSTQVGRTAHSIDRMVGKYHYQPKTLDDSLSAYLFMKFIDAIDPSGYYFLQPDIDKLKQHEFEIDDQIRNKSSEFFDETAKIFHQRLESADSLIADLMSKPFDFEKDEYIYSNEEYIPFVNDHAALKERWRKWLKSAVLEELFEGDFFEDASLTTIDSLKMYIPEASKAVWDNEKFEINSFIKHPSGYNQYLATYFLGAMTAYYDPHTSYFSDIDREQFQAELSKDNYAFGFSLKEDERGRVLIAGLTPGGAAWMSNSISQNDVILKIQFGKGKIVDVTVLSLDELILIFDASTAESLTLTLEKANGLVEEVELLKTEIYVDEDVIKSVILEGEKKVGYITLPDFYTDWDQVTGLGCANDIAKNIVKLKQENIDGLILDLRNNGGGSLKEAIDLAGIFIDWGPITIEQNRDRDPSSLKDMNKGAIYSGPLVILVNGLSASASEIFSAAMQDYNRALIVGSKTYGKSTGQVVLPLDPAFNFISGNMDDVDEDYGFIKITGTKFYRITNETHQKEGVIPDVALRDYYELYEYAESLNEMALEKDQVVKKVYYTPFAEFPVSKLQSNSNFRMSMNILYQEMCGVIDSISNFDEYYEKIPLSLVKYQQNERIMNELYAQLFTGELEPSEHFKVVNNKFDMEILKMNTYRAKLNEEYLEDVSKDLYIGEAYNVLLDLIQSK